MIGSAFIKLSEVLGKRAEERFEVLLESSLKRENKGLRQKVIDPQDTEDDPFIFSFGWLNEEDSRSKIALRFRSATDLDLKFMQKFEQIVKKNDYSYFLRNERNKEAKIIVNSFGRKTYIRSGQNLVTEISRKSVGLNEALNKLTHTFRSKIKDSSGLEKRRVKPYPDPANKNDTTFLSCEELRTEVFKPSTKWLHDS